MPRNLTGQTLLNQYYVEEYITLTPLGELFRATETRSNKALALTLLPKSISDDTEALKEFELVSKPLRGITHQNLIPYLGLYQTPTLAFILEEWADGPSLKYILQRAPVGFLESLVYVKSISKALDVLHKNNYLHLNLCPELIHIDKQGSILLSGIAFSKPVGDKMPTRRSGYPHSFYAPEQFSHKPLTTAADIYALAVLMYMLNTGRYINGKSQLTVSKEIRSVQLKSTPPTPISLNSSIPDHFSRMILWALRNGPEDRFKTTTEFLSALALAGHIPTDEIPDRINLESSPITFSILSQWIFPPPQKPALLMQDKPPLEDRLAALTSPQTKKNTRRIGLAPVFIFILLTGLFTMFWITRPASQSIPTPIHFTPFAANYTPVPTFTALPRPTDPHGGRIAYTCTRGNFNQICMINRDGTGLTQLTDMDASNYYPTFSPDGGSLLFSSNRNGSFDLYLLLFSEKQLFQITKNVGNVVSPDYSPDGRRIVFANRASDGPTSIWMVNADGLNPHLVYAGTDTIVATAWSPDGEKIAYAMSVGIPQEYEIFTMDTNGRNHIRISQGLKGIGGSIDWSPDGKSLLIYAGPYGDKNIFILDISNGIAKQITHGGNNAGASYSPDGLYIVFNSLRNNNQADLYIMRSNGDNQVQLTNNPEPDWGPVWVQ
jgi:serine/threonine protein kinase